MRIIIYREVLAGGRPHLRVTCPHLPKYNSISTFKKIIDFIWSDVKIEEKTKGNTGGRGRGLTYIYPDVTFFFLSRNVTPDLNRGQITFFGLGPGEYS